MEAEIVSKMAKELRAAGAYVEKNHGSQFQARGRPDLEGCLQGRFFGIEVKVPGQKPSLIQQHTLSEIRRAGGYGGSLDNLEDLGKFLAFFPNVCQQCLVRPSSRLYNYRCAKCLGAE